jgi:hypothetical protein
MVFNYFAQQKQQNNPNERQQAVQQQVTQPVTLPSQPQQTPVAKPQPTLPAIDPNSDTAGMDALSSMVTTPQEEERMRQASVANRRIMAVADALRHIGNIYNTVNYAPAQQFNNPVQEEQQRYEKGKALRDAANVKYYTYQQAKAAQDAKQRQWEATFNYNAAKDAANAKALADYRGATLAERKRQADQTLAFNKEKWKEQSDLNERKFKKQSEYQNRIAGIAERRARNDDRRTTAYINSKSGGGRGSNPYTFPTKNGYISLGRDLNSNQIGKKALFGEMKKAGIIDDVWKEKYDRMYEPQEQSALLNTAISQWLMNDDKPADYMKKHFGASSVGEAPSIGWGDEDETDNGLEIGW